MVNFADVLLCDRFTAQETLHAEMTETDVNRFALMHSERDTQLTLYPYSNTPHPSSHAGKKHCRAKEDNDSVYNYIVSSLYLIFLFICGC